VTIEQFATKANLAVCLELSNVQIPGTPDGRYVAPDGQRFLVPLPQQENIAVPMSLVLNWPASLDK
jgi:hypothetical protein